MQDYSKRKNILFIFFIQYSLSNLIINIFINLDVLFYHTLFSLINLYKTAFSFL